MSCYLTSLIYKNIALIMLLEYSFLYIIVVYNYFFKIYLINGMGNN